MEFKTIDSKMKEIYFSPAAIKDDSDTAEMKFNFWNTMSIVASQNKAMLQLCPSQIIK